MSTSKSLPRTLDAWVQHLGKLPLPIEQQQHLRLRRILGDSRRTWREIAEAIESSPSFALQVLREANQSSNSLSDPAESIETALSRLGLSRCEALLNQAPALPENDIPLAFKQILLISQHASHQANGLFAGRLARLWQEVHWGSLLFLAPIWTLLAAHPELFEAWEQRVLVKGEAASKVEQELLGVPLLKLCLALSEQWRLPEWVTQGYRLLVGDRRERGEFVISSRGLEGGGIYAVSAALRDGAGLKLDLMPDVSDAEVAQRLGRMKAGETLANRLRKLGIPPVGVGLVMEFGRALPVSEAVKRLPIALVGPRPLDEAISVAGGVTESSVTDGLELRALPGVFVCGEMLDWEAPTGGYLLTASLATGRWAGQNAARRVVREPSHQDPDLR
mgnify:CR=1 FL=1